jgi:hypothetical protein
VGLTTADTTAGFKCWRRSALEKINLNGICSNGYVFRVEMCPIAEKLKLRIFGMPIYFRDRRVGKSKVTGGSRPNPSCAPLKFVGDTENCHLLEEARVLMTIEGFDRTPKPMNDQGQATHSAEYRVDRGAKLSLMGG